MTLSMSTFSWFVIKQSESGTPRLSVLSPCFCRTSIRRDLDAPRALNLRRIHIRPYAFLTNYAVLEQVFKSDLKIKPTIFISSTTSIFWCQTGDLCIHLVARRKSGIAALFCTKLKVPGKKVVFVIFLLQVCGLLYDYVHTAQWRQVNYFARVIVKPNLPYDS